jgi:hypothetical protein
MEFRISDLIDGLRSGMWDCVSPHSQQSELQLPNSKLQIPIPKSAIRNPKSEIRNPKSNSQIPRKVHYVKRSN